MVLSELTSLPGVSGNENAVRGYILEKARALADDVLVDNLGSVIAHKKGKSPNGKRVMLAAHMDEVGLIVTSICDDGLLRYETVGGIDPRVMVSKRVFVGEKAIPGVIGSKAIHLQTAADRAKPSTHDQLFIDIGAKDKADAEKAVSLGDYASFGAEYIPFGAGYVKSKALDDRVGCYNLLRLMAEDFPCDVTYAFTVQEETGLRGALCAARRVLPDVAIVLEGTTANDRGDVPEHLRVCSAGAGVSISFMDRTTIVYWPLVKALRELADQRSIPWQYKSFVAGGNDAGSIQNAAGAIPVASLSVPCRYIHSPSSVCALADVEAQYELARAFLNSGAAYDDQEASL